MLVIPSIPLHAGQCGLPSGKSAGRAPYADPLRTAKLWRVMNAKVLHLDDLDGDAPRRSSANRVAAAEIACALDIPVQLSARPQTVAEVVALLELGVARVVLDAEDGPALVADGVARVGASRLALALDAAAPDALDLASAAAAAGLRRLLVRAQSDDGAPDVARLRALAGLRRGVRVTATGGVRDYRDLVRLQTLQADGVDSVVLGEPLYANRFPCQRVWCWHQADAVDLDCFSTAPLAARSA